MTEVYLPHVGWLECPDDDDVALFLREGWFEYREIAFLWLYLRPGDVVVDCGAHAGLFSVVAGRVTGGAGRLVAVEPNSDTARLLRRNLTHHGLAAARVVEVAVDEQRGEAALHLMPAGKAAYASLCVSTGSTGDVSVHTTTLDDLLRDEGLGSVDFLKLDIEGAEVRALAGAARAVAERRLPLIMVEVTELNLRAAGESTETLRRAFTNAGYQLCRFNAASLTLEADRAAGPIWYDNLFACLDPDAVRQRFEACPPEHVRVAQEIVRRGEACLRVKDALASATTGQQRASEERDALVDAQRALEARVTQLVDERDAAQEATRALRGQVDQSDQIARERLRLLRRSHAEHQLAERRIDHDLLGLWPLRLALGARLVRRPSWLTPPGRRWHEPNDPVAAHIAEATAAAIAQAETDGTTQSAPRVSVVLCTYNPRRDLLAWSLEAIARQTLDPSDYEVVLVDNNSDPPVSLHDYRVASAMPIRLVRESRQGLIHARVAGIRATSASLIVFVDDDNYLDPHYLTRALEVAESDPDIGLFGGIARGRFEGRVARWKQPLLPFLGVRDNGPDPITSHEPYWGEWEPIGAGMVARRDVATAYVDFVDDHPTSGGLGRAGRALSAGEDTLFARVANRCGYACSYQPALSVEHYIPLARLTSRYLFRLIRGMGHSYVRLERVLGRGQAVRPLGAWQLLGRLPYRVGQEGLAGVFRWGWDVGYRAEAGVGDDGREADAATTTGSEPR